MRNNILVFILLGISFLFVFMFISKRDTLKIRLIMVTNSKWEIENPDWIMLTPNNFKNLEERLNITTLPAIDFEKEYYLLSFGKKIKHISYNSFELFVKKKCYGSPVFEGELNSNKVYVYSSEKINCVRDLRLGPYK